MRAQLRHFRVNARIFFACRERRPPPAPPKQAAGLRSPMTGPASCVPPKQVPQGLPGQKKSGPTFGLLRGSGGCLATPKIKPDLPSATTEFYPGALPQKGKTPAQFFV